MIVFEGVTAVTAAKKNAKTFLSDVNLVLPSDRRIALVGTDRDETTALMHLLSGLLPPRAGRVIRQSKVSFPVGFLGGFVSSLPVRDNVAYLARLYDADVTAILNFMRKIKKLGAVFDQPYGQLPRGTKADLAEILAYALPFDTYLLLQQPKPSEGSETDPVYQIFQARRRTAGMIIPTASKAFADEHCELGLVFEKGKLRLYQSLDEAFSRPQSQENLKHKNKGDELPESDPSEDRSLADMSLLPAQEDSGKRRLTKEERRARRKRLDLREKRRARRRAARGDVA